MTDRQNLLSAAEGVNKIIPCEVLEFVQNGGEEPYVNVKISISQQTMPDRGGDIAFDDYEEVHEVPIGYISTSEFALTIPIRPGDRGMLLIADKDMDNWNVEALPETLTGRRHNINDAIFYPGTWPRPKFMDGYSDEWLELRDLESLHRLAMSKEMVHLQSNLLRHLVLADAGFDVHNGPDTLMQIIIDLAQACAALATCTVICSSLAAGFEAIAGRAEILKGESTPPERDPQEFDRP